MIGYFSFNWQYCNEPAIIHRLMPCQIGFRLDREHQLPTIDYIIFSHLDPILFKTFIFHTAPIFWPGKLPITELSPKNYTVGLFSSIPYICKLQIKHMLNYMLYSRFESII